MSTVALLLGASACGSRSGLSVTGASGELQDSAVKAGSGQEGAEAQATQREAEPQGIPEASPSAAHDATEVVATDEPPSCHGGAAGAGNDCGASGTSDCCGSFQVPGGSFERTLDNGPNAGMQWPATVSGFRLDAYEVTVGRFRNFVNAAVGGWLPAAGSGKHTHLNGGRGLASAAGDGTYETGWDMSWNAQLLTTRQQLTQARSLFATWTPNESTNERLPMNLETWYEAYAFCIWDGGFLPSEAEWYYAASGGSEQRPYPWGSTTPGANADLAVYGCYFGGTNNCVDVRNVAPVGSVVAGNGKWGQSDLAGNLQEWNLDSFEAFSVPSKDCASITSGQRVVRGGSFELDATYLLVAGRNEVPPGARYDNQTIRCARSP